MEIHDEDVRMLAAIAGTLKADYADEDSTWSGSPFAWIITRPSRQIGTIGEKLVAGWCAAKDLDVTRPPNSDCDRVINGKRVEIKFSRLWKTGLYKFQQLRDQEYDFAICLGISPFDAARNTRHAVMQAIVANNCEEGKYIVADPHCVSMLGTSYEYSESSWNNNPLTPAPLLVKLPPELVDRSAGEGWFELLASAWPCSWPLLLTTGKKEIISSLLLMWTARKKKTYMPGSNIVLLSPKTRP